MATVTNGGDLMVFIGGKSIAFATSHSLSVSLATSETTSKDSGGKWQNQEGRLLSWTMSSENLMSADGQGETYDSLFTKMTARTAVELKWAIKSVTADDVPSGGWTPGTKYKKGNALITSLEANAPNGENATFTVTFTGCGPITDETAD